jgi:formamidopyrimidine-DNA glycosylase
VEPLDLPVRDFTKILNRNRQIKALLLDQTVIAGIGNIYCDESLFRAGVHPTVPGHELDKTQIGVLLRIIKRVLREAIKERGSTISDYRRTDGSEGTFQQQHRVYGREGSACVACGAKIIRMVVAGRSTFVCAACQPRSTPAST